MDCTEFLIPNSKGLKLAAVLHLPGGVAENVHARVFEFSLGAYK